MLDRRKRSVSHVRFTNVNLSQIEQDILSSFIVRLTAVILDLNYLTSDQTMAIFEKVKMTIIDITTCMDLSDYPFPPSCAESPPAP